MTITEQKINMSNSHKISPYTFPGMNAQSLKEKIGSIGPQVVFDCVCEKYGISRKQLRSSSRQRTTTTARHLMMYLLMTQSSMTCKAVGKMLKRHYTSVLHGRGKIIEYIQVYPSFAVFVEGIVRGLRVPAGHPMPDNSSDISPPSISLKQVERPSAEYSNHSPMGIAS